MLVSKCDICKKTISEQAAKIHLTLSGFDTWYLGIDFCQKCGKDILNFLKHKGIIKQVKKGK